MYQVSDRDGTHEILDVSFLLNFCFSVNLENQNENI